MALIVYGATCVWWDSIDMIDTIPRQSGLPGLPCCPHCKGVLFQTEEADWNAGTEKYQAADHPGYVDFINWLRGKCFPDQQAARAAYEAEKGL